MPNSFANIAPSEFVLHAFWHPFAKNAWLFPGRDSSKAFTPRAFFAVLHSAASSAGVAVAPIASALWDSPVRGPGSC